MQILPMASMSPEDKTQTQTQTQTRTRNNINFALPTWGSKNLLRCSNNNNENDAVSVSVNVNVNPQPPPKKRRHPHNDAVSVSKPSHKKRRYSQTSSFYPAPSSTRPELFSVGNDHSQIESIREKLIIDLRCEVESMRAAFLEIAGVPTPTPAEVVTVAVAPVPAVEARPWNLRTRRAACSEQTAVIKSTPPAGGGSGDGEGGVSGEREKFSVALTKAEIEDDFLEMIGKRPPRRPKKRPRYIKRKMDTLFPGLWLSEITPDMYTVEEENPEVGK